VSRQTCHVVPALSGDCGEYTFVPGSLRIFVTVKITGFEIERFGPYALIDHTIRI